MATLAVTLTFQWPTEPVVDARLSLMLPGEHRVIAHDYFVDDGAHGKDPFKPRGFDLPETEKRKHPEHAKMIYNRALLFYEGMKLCAPATGLEKLPPDLRQARTLDGVWHEWLNDYWWNRLSAFDQWYLFAIYWSRAVTNKVSIDIPGYIDPITGFGLPDEFGNTQEYKVEGIGFAGNVVTIASGVGGSGVAVWCLDGLATSYPPTAHILQYRDLFHVFTISTTNNHNPTPVGTARYGTWDVDPYGILNGNAVLVPQFSVYNGDNAATTVIDGIPLRANWYEPIRIQAYSEPWTPYNPTRPLFPRG